MASHRFANRAAAGQRLARELGEYAGRAGLLVLGLPRGGVPVAAEVAAALGAPLDVFLVRKLGVPGHAELAMGAIAEGGVQVLDERLIRDLGIAAASIDQTAARERAELDRRHRQFRGSRPAPAIAGRTVIVVDDGLATGATMEAALKALRTMGPAMLIAAAPVGAPDTCRRLAQYADRVVCSETPRDLGAVGLWYDDFNQTTDDEVTQLLAPSMRARQRSSTT